MFKGRLGVWIFVLLLAIGGPWLYEQVPTWFHTDGIVVASEMTNVDMLDAISQERFGHLRVQTTTEEPDVIFTTDTQPREGYEFVENAAFSPMTLYVTYYANEYENGFIQDDANSYMLKINLHTILVAMEDGSTWQDIGINRKVLEGKVTLSIPDENDWCYPFIEDLFYMTLNGGQMPDEAQRETLKPRVDKLLSKCEKCPSISQAITDEAEDPSDGHKAFLGPEYLYMTCAGMGTDNYTEFIPIALTKTLSISANAYIKTAESGTGETCSFCGYNSSELAAKFMEEIGSNKNFMKITGWRVKDSKFDITGVWSRLPNVV